MLKVIQNIFGISRYELTTVTQAKQYLVGQVWSYKTRHQEPHSQLTIVRIDKDIKGELIIHVWLDQLQLKNPNHPEGVIRDLPHTPLSLAALDCSVTQLVKTVANLPDYSEGYSVWLEAWNRGKANIYSMPIREIIEFVEKSLCQGKQESQT